MKFRGSEIRMMIREAIGALRMLDTVTMKVILTKGIKIEEVLTGIRIIKGVATVNQSEPVQRMPGGQRILNLIVSFDSKDMEVFDYIDSMARLTKKSIEDVNMVVVKSVNGQHVRDITGKRKLVY